MLVLPPGRVEWIDAIDVVQLADFRQSHIVLTVRPLAKAVVRQERGSDAPSLKRRPYHSRRLQLPDILSLVDPG
jgi:hypothetical protein